MGHSRNVKCTLRSGSYPSAKSLSIVISMDYRGHRASAPLPEQTYLYAISSQMNFPTGKDIPPFANYFSNMVFPDTTLSQVIGSMSQFSRASFPSYPRVDRTNPDFHFHFLPLKLISQTVTQACFNRLFHPYLFHLCLILSERAAGGRNGM